MTAFIALTVVFLAGVLVGFTGRYQRIQVRAARLAHLEHGLRPAVSDGFNPDAPRRRRRSPDRKAERQPAPLPRPGFHITR